MSASDQFWCCYADEWNTAKVHNESRQQSNTERETASKSVRCLLLWLHTKVSRELPLTDLWYDSPRNNERSVHVQATSDWTSFNYNVSVINTNIFSPSDIQIIFFHFHVLKINAHTFCLQHELKIKNWPKMAANFLFFALQSFVLCCCQIWNVILFFTWLSVGKISCILL